MFVMLPGTNLAAYFRRKCNVKAVGGSPDSTEEGLTSGLSLCFWDRATLENFTGAPEFILVRIAFWIV
jgi:hypothetical protein